MISLREFLEIETLVKDPPKEIVPEVCQKDLFSSFSSLPLVEACEDRLNAKEVDVSKQLTV